MDMTIYALVKKIGPAHFRAGMVVQIETPTEIMLAPRYFTESAARRAAHEFVRGAAKMAEQEGKTVEFNSTDKTNFKVLANPEGLPA